MRAPTSGKRAWISPVSYTHLVKSTDVLCIKGKSLRIINNLPTLDSVYSIDSTMEDEQISEVNECGVISKKTQYM